MTRVTLDTNELISAISFRGKALELIHRAIHGEIEIAISTFTRPLTLLPHT